MKVLLRATSPAVALAVIFGNAFAQHANVTSTSIDGPGTDAQTQLRNLGIRSDVIRDQVTGRVFVRKDPTKPVSITTLFSYAANKEAHKLGFYQPTGVASNPTWHIGGNQTGLPETKNVTVNGRFAIALESPDGLFRSERQLNSDNFEHFAVVKLKYATNSYVPDAYVVLMEDLKDGGDQDYNDRAILICNVEAVPEPASMIALAGGVAALLRRRNRK